ncbi:MAG: hypothetical protein ACK5NE_01095 [Brachymonas sp.]
MKSLGIPVISGLFCCFALKSGNGQRLLPDGLAEKACPNSVEVIVSIADNDPRIVAHFQRNGAYVSKNG